MEHGGERSPNKAPVSSRPRKDASKDTGYYLDFIYICGDAQNQIHNQAGSQQQGNENKNNTRKIETTRTPATNNKLASTNASRLFDKSLDANFRLATRTPLAGELPILANRGQRRLTLSCDRLVSSADLLASRRARYRELMSSGRVAPKRRRSLLSLSRKLLLLGASTSNLNYSSAASHRQAANGKTKSKVRGLKRHASSGGTGGSNLAGQLGGDLVRISPTSSLSTLIRKFNQDQYTSVCQQSGAAAESQSGTKNQTSSVAGAPPNSVAILMEDSARDQTASIERKPGGLYYNYSLWDHPQHQHESSTQESLSRSKGLERTNPLHQLGAGSPPDLVLDSVGRYRKERDSDLSITGQDKRTPPVNHETTGGLDRAVSPLPEGSMGEDRKQAKSVRDLMDKMQSLIGTTTTSNANNNNNNNNGNPQNNCGDERRSTATVTPGSKEDSLAKVLATDADSTTSRSVLSEASGSMMRSCQAPKKTTINNLENNGNQTQSDNTKPVAKWLLSDQQEQQQDRGPRKRLVPQTPQSKSRKYTQVIATAEELARLRKEEESGSFLGTKLRHVPIHGLTRIAAPQTTNADADSELEASADSGSPMLGSKSRKPSQNSVEPTTPQTAPTNRITMRDATDTPATNNLLQALEHFKPPPNCSNNYNYDTLDYASLVSMDDALSLVSVSSEFEYHNLGQQQPSRGSTRSPIGSPRIGHQGGKRNQTNQKKRQQEQPLDAKKQQSEIVNDDEQPSSAGFGAGGVAQKKPPLDVRFPSFLAKPSGSGSNRSGQTPARPASESSPSKSMKPPPTNIPTILLNLTNAKFANVSQWPLSSHLELPLAPSTKEQAQPIEKRQSSRLGVRSKESDIDESIGRTITKQRSSQRDLAASQQQASAPQSAKRIALVLNEFGWRSQQTTVNSTGGSLLSAKSQPTPESSLPLESGNVKARIRKFQEHQDQHQLQSTPNLLINEGQQNNHLHSKTNHQNGNKHTAHPASHYQSRDISGGGAKSRANSSVGSSSAESSSHRSMASLIPKPLGQNSRFGASSSSQGHLAGGHKMQQVGSKQMAARGSALTGSKQLIQNRYTYE